MGTQLTVMEFNLVLSKGGLQAQWRQSVDTEELVRREMDSASEQQVQKWLKEVGKIWEVFEVRRRGCEKEKEESWRVAKSHDQVQQFIIEYNLRFKARLLFGSFMLQGIKEVFENGAARDWPPFISFFEMEQLGVGKVKSVRLLKKSGGRYKDYFCCRLPWQWNQRDFVITRSGVLYLSNDQPKEYLPFGASFRLFKGKAETGYDLGIRLEANHRKLLLYAQNAHDFFQFLYFVGRAQSEAPMHTENRFRSFAPVRKGNSVQFMVDGEEYFAAVARGVQRAQEQLMLTGWYISPEFQLVRPVSKHKEQRLDQLLKRAADRGVRVFVLVYNESSFLNNDSAYVKQTLQALSPSIKVLQHPLGVLPTFWSHHQKLVIVDQSQAFMGGLDLGFGRFDNHQHLISHNDPDYYPGMEYNNQRTVDLTRVREFWRDGIPRETPRLPWHDVGLHVSGEVVLDLAHHFIEYWNYASFQTYYQDRYVLVLQRQQPKKPLLRQLRDDIANKFKGLGKLAGQLKSKIFPPSQPSRSNSESDQPVREQEIHLAVVEGSSESRSSSQRGKRGKWGAKFQQSWYETASPQTMKAEEEGGSGVSLKRRFASMKELDDIVYEMQDQIDKIDFMEDVEVTRRGQLQPIEEQAEEEFACQVVRSVGSWSIGCQPNNKETSIHTAYLTLIRTARRFIYIENQFFISMTPNSLPTVRNQVANQIYLRIAAAVEQGEPFKVWVVIPLIPGFAGELDDPDAVIPRVIMHWQYSTICRGENSLFARIAALNVNPSDYIQFFGLRTHGMVAERPRTEIVYVHSKLMIADDQRAICGSANINERSMRGSRDSQVCLIIEEGPMRQVRGYSVNQNIFALRLRLFHQHFGSDLDASDASDTTLWRQVQERTKKNTALYREIFKCYPDDYVNTLADLTLLRNAGTREELYEQRRDQIVGFAVEFPLQFLKDQDLLVGATLYPDSLSV